MKYKVLSIDFKEAKNHRFYREICVKEDLNLEYLGKILVFCLGGTLEHSYLFDDGEFSYVDKSWLGNPSDNYIDYSKTIVKQLPNKFLFEACKYLAILSAVVTIPPTKERKNIDRKSKKLHQNTLFLSFKPSISLFFKLKDLESCLYA